MNLVILTGNLTKDPTIAKTNTGVSVVSGTIAVRRDFKNPNGEYDVDYIDFIAYRNEAEYLATYAKKGGRLELQGKWRTRKYTDQEGNNRLANDVIVDSVFYFPKREVAY